MVSLPQLVPWSKWRDPEPFHRTCVSHSDLGHARLCCLPKTNATSLGQMELDVEKQLAVTVACTLIVQQKKILKSARQSFERWLETRGLRMWFAVRASLICEIQIIPAYVKAFKSQVSSTDGHLISLRGLIDFDVYHDIQSLSSSVSHYMTGTDRNVPIKKADMPAMAQDCVRLCFAINWLRCSRQQERQSKAPL